jgi:hypothetical protein
MIAFDAVYHTASNAPPPRASPIGRHLLGTPLAGATRAAKTSVDRRIVRFLIGAGYCCG